MAHRVRQMVKTLLAPNRSGTPFRIAHGQVVSSTIGQSTVTLDGNSTHVDAWNCSHTQSLAAGTTVLVLVYGKVLYVVGAF